MIVSALAVASTAYGAYAANKAKKEQQAAINQNTNDVKELTAAQIDKVKASEKEKLDYLQNGDVFGDMG